MKLKRFVFDKSIKMKTKNVINFDQIRLFNIFKFNLLSCFKRRLRMQVNKLNVF
jgi:hypothetical protein